MGKILVIAFVLLAALETAPFAAAADNWSDEDALKDKAFGVLKRAFDSPVPAVLKAALRGLGFCHTPEVFDMVQEVFYGGPGDDVVRLNTWPGFSYIRNEALSALFHIDALGAKIWFLRNQAVLLDLFSLDEVVQAAGFDFVPALNNVFYYADFCRPYFTAMVYAYYYAKTGENKYLLAMEGFMDAFAPLETDEVLSFLEKYRVDPAPLKFAVLDRLGFLKCRDKKLGFNRTFTLDELLYQALLCRYGMAGEVYRKDFVFEKVESQYQGKPFFETETVLTNADAVIGGATNEGQQADITDLMGVSNLPCVVYKDNSPYYDNNSMLFSLKITRTTNTVDLGSGAPVNRFHDALASFYAGRPEARHYDIAALYIPAMSAYEASVLAGSPDNPLRTKLLAMLLASSNSEARPEALLCLAGSGDRSVLDAAGAIAEAGRLPPCEIALALEILGRGGDKKYLPAIGSYLSGANEFLAVSAAAAIMELTGGLK